MSDQNQLGNYGNVFFFSCIIPGRLGKKETKNLNIKGPNPKEKNKLNNPSVNF